MRGAATNKEPGVSDSWDDAERVAEIDLDDDDDDLDDDLGDDDDDPGDDGWDDDE